VISPSVMDDGIIYLGSQADSSTHGFVDAYRASDGKLLWEYDTGASSDASMLTVSNGVLYANLSMSLLALRGNDGTVLWQHAQSGPISGSPLVASETIYLNNSGEVFAFIATNGAQRWHFRPSSQASPSDTHVSLGNGLVFAGG